MYIQVMFLASKTEDNHIISQNVVGIIKVKRGYSRVCHHAAYINGEAMGGYRGVGVADAPGPIFLPPFPPLFGSGQKPSAFHIGGQHPLPPLFV